MYGNAVTAGVQSGFGTFLGTGIEVLYIFGEKEIMDSLQELLSSFTIT